MRILFTCRATSGHFHPLVPLAEAARDAGHDVAFGIAPVMRAAVERLGLRWFAAGLDESSPDYARFIQERNRLPGRERAAFMRRGAVTFLGPHMATGVLRIADGWRPDVLVRDHSDHGGYVAAEVLGIPHASHHAAGFNALIAGLLAEPLAELRATFGLPPDPALDSLERYLVLSPFPPTLDGSSETPRPTLQRYRAAPFDRSGEEGVPEWLRTLSDAPLVYATLGTAVNARTEILSAFVEALRDEPVNLVVTVGRNGDPSAFGPQPPNVHIERYIPQSLLFSRCRLVISHGGSNTMLAAFAHGIPQVMVPITADQPENGERCEAAGAACVVPPSAASPASIREAALAVLADPSYRQSAERLRDEMAILPSPAAMVMLLERLARDKAPILAAP
jgi:UDP:flavonoid glycosyltransferase YjiC (YdhE family)